MVSRLWEKFWKKISPLLIHNLKVVVFSKDAKGVESMWFYLFVFLVDFMVVFRGWRGALESGNHHCSLNPDILSWPNLKLWALFDIKEVLQLLLIIFSLLICDFFLLICDILLLKRYFLLLFDNVTLWERLKKRKNFTPNQSINYNK